MSFDRLDVFYFAGIVIAVIFHEVAHGLAARRFGDDTAERAGRLTLNPVPHIDPFGSIIMPLLGTLSGLPYIAWAKPVPVNPRKLSNPRRDMLLVSLAGPGSNAVLAAIAAVVARVTYASNPDSAVFEAALAFATVNLFLAVFNLLPIPPLDGSAILERMLPARHLETWYRFRPYGMLVLFLLVFSTNLIGRIASPFLDGLYEFVAAA